MKNPSIIVVSLGCPKNLVESERIVTALQKEGYDIVNHYHKAHLVIVNTCGFIEDAIQESLDVIREALFENGKVIVTGCLGTQKVTILERHPQVLGITGPHATDEVVNLVRQHLPNDRLKKRILPEQGIKLTPPHYAYLKISEGCNNKCTYCIIPKLCGPLKSEPIDKILNEAEVLVRSGVKELIVVSQDTANYGMDLGFQNALWKNSKIKTNFIDLVSALSEFGIWIRLHYLYPYPHIDEVLPLMADRKIVPYLDVPFQHASNHVLKLMRRPANIENQLKRIESWRSICPDVTIRSTFIVGFPGETEEDFCELLDFIEDAKLDRVGCFMYSQVRGAEANNLPGYISHDVKLDRQDRLMNLQSYISETKLQSKIGKTIDVIIDEVNKKKGLCIGRSFGDSPEIDGIVNIKSDSKIINPGDIVKVIVTDSGIDDLSGILS